MDLPDDDTKPDHSQLDVELTVHYLQWDAQSQREWIEEAARLAVDMFLAHESRENESRQLRAPDEAR